MTSIDKTCKEQKAENLLINIHNIGLENEPDELEISKELRNFDSNSLAAVKRNLFFLTHLVNKEYTRRNK
jgi:hypothetical protein